MAVTTTTDVASALVPAVISPKTFDATVANVVLSGLADQDTSLEGTAGDRVTIGSFADIGEAIDLAENEAITPKKFTATATQFVVGRIGDGVAYTRDAVIKTGIRMSDKAGTALGKAVARRIDTKLGLAALSQSLVGNRFGDGTTALTAGMVAAGSELFEDEDETPVLAATSRQWWNLAVDLGALDAGTFGNDEIIRNGVRAAAPLLGVRPVITKRLPSVSGTRRSALMFLPGRTLVSAFSMRPLVEYDEQPARNAVDVYVNTIWAGGVQDPATLATFDTTNVMPTF